MVKIKDLTKNSWVFSTYFAEGLPYSLIAIIPSIMFRDSGIDLSTIGFLSLLNIPWVIKFFWAPIVDSKGLLKKWIFSTELAITFAIALLSLSLFFDNLMPVVIFLCLGAVFSATHDIAVDGFYMASLDEETQKKQIGFRVLAYRLALAFGSGVIVSIGTLFSWRCAYGTAAFFMLGLYLFHRFFLLESQKETKVSDNSFESFKLAFASYFKRDRILSAVIFIIFLRAGEYMLGLMRGPFMVDLGIKIHIGWISGAVAIPASIAGAVFGGYLISKKGVTKTAIPIILFQNLTNLLYAALAFFYSRLIQTNNISPDSVMPENTGIILTAVVNGIESFSSGMGTALLMIFLIKMCKNEFKAAHYAIGSGLMAISGAILNSIGGVTAQHVGYGWFFVISFAVAMPAVLFFRKEIVQS